MLKFLFRQFSFTAGIFGGFRFTDYRFLARVTGKGNYYTEDIVCGLHEILVSQIQFTLTQNPIIPPSFRVTIVQHIVYEYRISTPQAQTNRESIFNIVEDCLRIAAVRDQGKMERILSTFLHSVLNCSFPSFFSVLSTLEAFHPLVASCQHLHQVAVAGNSKAQHNIDFLCGGGTRISLFILSRIKEITRTDSFFFRIYSKV